MYAKTMYELNGERYLMDGSERLFWCAFEAQAEAEKWLDVFAQAFQGLNLSLVIRMVTRTGRETQLARVSLRGD